MIMIRWIFPTANNFQFFFPLIAEDQCYKTVPSGTDALDEKARPFVARKRFKPNLKFVVSVALLVYSTAT
jgi:hypothetical protein